MSATKESILRDNLEHTLFSWSKQKGLDPINVERAEGVYVYDRDGKRYVDFSSQLMNVNIGHGDPRVRDAVVRQMEKFSFVYPGMATEVRGELGRRLAEIAPGNLRKTFFTLGGADAVENAIKIARLFTGRHKILSRYRSYHGATYGAISAGGDPRRIPVDSQAMPGIVHFEAPNMYRSPYGDDPEVSVARYLEHLERIVGFEGPGNVAAILLEGESGSSGCLKIPTAYWKGVRNLCDRHGILLIADEVMSGFCRTGKWFGIQNHDVEPDLLTFAKGVTSGYVPLGGVTVSDKIAAMFDDTVMPLGLTYSAHPLSCAAALACLDIYESESLADRAARMGKYVEGKVAELAERHPCVGDFRNTGLLGCIELVKDRGTKEPMAPWNATPDRMGCMNDVMKHIRGNGMFTFVRWNYIFVAPPLTITEAQVDEGLAIIDGALSIADRHLSAM